MTRDTLSTKKSHPENKMGNEMSSIKEKSLMEESAWGKQAAALDLTQPINTAFAAQPIDTNTKFVAQAAVTNPQPTMSKVGEKQSRDEESSEPSSSPKRACTQSTQSSPSLKAAEKRQREDEEVSEETEEASPPSSKRARAALHQDGLYKLAQYEGHAPVHAPVETPTTIPVQAPIQVLSKAELGAAALKESLAKAKSFFDGKSLVTVDGRLKRKIAEDDQQPSKRVQLEPLKFKIARNCEGFEAPPNAKARQSGSLLFIKAFKSPEEQAVLLEVAAKKQAELDAAAKKAAAKKAAEEAEAAGKTTSYKTKVEVAGKTSSTVIKPKAQRSKPKASRYRSRDSITDTRRRHSLFRPKPKKEVFTFLKFPGEIREIIFKHCVNEWNGRSPSVILALRSMKNPVPVWWINPDTKKWEIAPVYKQAHFLYYEALHYFYVAGNTYFLNRRNGWSFCQMKPRLLETVTKIKIEIKEYQPNAKNPQKNWLMTPKPRQITKHYKHLPKLKEVTIQGNYGNVNKQLFARFPDYLMNATNLQSVDVDFRFFPLSETQRNMLMAPTFYGEIQREARRISTLFRAQGQENVTERMRRMQRSKITSAVWYWEAEEGKHLKGLRRKKRTDPDSDDEGEEGP